MEVAAVIMVALIFGSFATAVAYRLPRGKQFVSGRSKCPSCGHKLGFFDLFPVLSWLLLKGRCRYCGKKFGSSYIIAECLLTAMILMIYLKFGITAPSLLLAALSVCIVTMIIIDFEHYIIPDSINATMFAISLIYMFLIEASWQQFVIGPILGLSIGFALRWIMWAWKKREGLGLGDVKFLAVAGLVLPFDLIITFFFMAGVIGIITALVWKILGKGKEFPFGPALSLSMYFCLVIPELNGYLQDFIRVVVARLI